MSNSGQAQEPTMEEILASIRRIISEDDAEGEGKDKAPAAVTEKLEASLQTLKGLAEKPESLNEQDIDTVIKVTEDVLALL